MPITYEIIHDLRTVYFKGTGDITADEIKAEGARMFADNEWTNGFNILIDYRGITNIIAKTADIEKIVGQDKKNKPLFDKSKCAIVASSDLVYGLSRMWEALSGSNIITAMVFRNIEDALKWLGLNVSAFQSIKELP